MNTRRRFLSTLAAACAGALLAPALAWSAARPLRRALRLSTRPHLVVDEGSCWAEGSVFGSLPLEPVYIDDETRLATDEEMFSAMLHDWVFAPGTTVEAALFEGQPGWSGWRPAVEHEDIEHRYSPFVNVEP